jgi:hypothetical protein
VAFGGLFPDGRVLAALLTPETAEATACLEETGFWKAGDLSARSWLYVI